jgi:hypothetical protein
MTQVGHTTLGGETGDEGLAVPVARGTTRFSIAGHRYLYAATGAFVRVVAYVSVVDVKDPRTHAQLLQHNSAGSVLPGRSRNRPSRSGILRTRSPAQ